MMGRDGDDECQSYSHHSCHSYTGHKSMVMIVIMLKTANDEETIFLKKLVIKLLKFGRRFLSKSVLLSWKTFFWKYSVIKLKYWFIVSIIVGNSIKKLLNWIDNIGNIKKNNIVKIKKNNDKTIDVAIPLLILFASKKSTKGSKR